MDCATLVLPVDHAGRWAIVQPTKNPATGFVEDHVMCREGGPRLYKLALAPPAPRAWRVWRIEPRSGGKGGFIFLGVDRFHVE